MVSGREGRVLYLPPEEGGSYRESSNGGRQASGSPRPRMPVRSQCPGPGPIVSIQPLPALANSFLRGRRGRLTEPFWVGDVVQLQQSPGGPKGAMRRRCVEIRPLHSSEAGEALIRLLQVQVDFYIFFFGID